MTKSVTCEIEPQYCCRRPIRIIGRPAAPIVRELAHLSMTHRPVKDAELARSFGYSRSQFRRLCQDGAGETPRAFVLRLRLERAAGQLASSDHPVALIASEAGFVAREAFARAFAGHFGCTPAKFRQLNRGASPRLPGHVLACGGRWQRSVRVRTAGDTETTFMFEGPLLLGRVLANGTIDWR